MTSAVMIIINNSGGLYIFRKKLMQELMNKGYEVIAISPYTSRMDDIRAMGVNLIESPIDRRGMNPVHECKLIKTYISIIKKVNPQYIITYTIKPNIYGGIIAKVRGIPYAINITGLGTAFQKDNILKRVTSILYKVSLAGARVVFFENEDNAQFFVGNGLVNEEKAVVLQGAGVDTKHFYYLEYPKEDDCTNFIFIGRIMKEKGVEELFQAIQRLNRSGYRCKLTVVGTFEEDYSEVIELYQKENWLDYKGFSQDVREFIINSHCSVLPSWHEGMSNTNLECASCGRPLITTNIPGCKEAVIEHVSGLLCKVRDVDGLYAAMKAFIELPLAEKEKMGQAGREYMIKCFEKSDVVNKTISEMRL